MVQSVELQKLALANSVTRRRSGEHLVRLKMVRTCQGKVVCELNIKWKAKEGFQVCTGCW